jgi:putative transposase
MPEISTILLCCSEFLTPTQHRHLLLLIDALLSMNGRITLLGISRWTEKGASYRTLQRFAVSVLNWQALNWLIFQQFFLHKDDVILLAADTTTITKSGKKTYGLGRFYSSIVKRAVPALAFECISLVSVKSRQAFPILFEQVTPTPKKPTPAKAKRKTTKGKAGRPKGSRNKNQQLELTDSTRWLKGHLETLLKRIQGRIQPIYFLYDNAMGNAQGIMMCRSLGLHLVSKLYCNAALWFLFEGEYSGKGRHRIYGDKVNYQALPDHALKATETDDKYQSKTYQLTLRHKDLPVLINVVILQKTCLKTQKVAQVILFSTDLTLSWENLVLYYRLRFQIEFVFRDAKQYWGLEDFMNVGQQQVYNMANLSLFMVNLSRALQTMKAYEGMSILQLKAWCQAGKYVRETLKSLPQNLEPHFISQIIEQVCRFPRENPQTCSV